MSLTTLIRTDREFRDVLAAAIRRPAKPAVRPTLRVERQSTRYNVTGTAFDYLLRFELERRHPQHAVTGGTWIAEQGVAYLSRHTRKAHAFLQDTRSLHATFLRGEACLPALARAATVLAKLDLVVRAGWEDPQPLEPIEDMADELLQLLAAVPIHDFEAKHTLLTNPNFGPASFAVGGADADLILDTCLIDIKTTLKAEVSLDELRQLVGYVLLHRLGGSHLSSGHTVLPVPSTVQSVGLYYARYGVLYRFELTDLIDPHGWQGLMSWFLNRSLELRPVGEDRLPWPAGRSRVAMEAWLEEAVVHAKFGIIPEGI